jgi:hypothetical protein
MDKSKQKMMKARIRRRKKSEVDVEAVEPDSFTEETCGLPPANLGMPVVLHPPLLASAFCDMPCSRELS